MTALTNAKAQFFLRTTLVLLISLLFTLNLESVNADQNSEIFGHLALKEKWQGDFSGMIERRLVRALVVLDRFYFYIDQGDYRGVSADLLKAFEKFINKKNKGKALQIEVIFLPVYRDQLIPALLEGKGDIAVGNLTISRELLKIVDFSTPFLSGVKDMVITNSKFRRIDSIEDLSDQKVYLRSSSSSYQHAQKLNLYLKEKGLQPMNIVGVEDYYEDSYLLEMVNSGLIDVAVVNDHIAKFWSNMFKDIRLHEDIIFSEDGYTGWAFRKDSPELAEVINGFLKNTKKGTKLGNVILEKNMQDKRWAERATLSTSIERYRSIVALIKKYADQYEFDYLMTKALAYQESQLDNSKRSPCGAVGIMQLLPKTAADKNVGISNIENVENNIHAGHKYLRFLQDRYFSTPEIDYLNKHLLTFAAYNAGPSKLIKLRNAARSRGLDPNVWFKNVEIVAADKIGRETVQYVSSIYKKYIAYKLASDKHYHINNSIPSLAEIVQPH